MTEQKSKAYLKSVWRNVDLSPYHRTEHLAVRVGGAGFVNFAVGGAESLTKAVTYTKKLLAEIAEVEEEIEYLECSRDGAEHASWDDSEQAAAAFERTIARLRAILAEKRAGMKEGK